MKKIQTIIEDYLSKQYNERKHDRGGHYPSEANACSRQLWYKWKKTPESDPVYPTALIKMDIGNGIHKLVADWLKASGLELTEEVPFKYAHEKLKFPISGRMDIVYKETKSLDDMSGSVVETLKGIEVKSGFGRGISDIKEKGQPKLEHIMQAAIYMHCTNVKEFKIVYVARDAAVFLEFDLKTRDGKIYCDEILIPDMELEKIIDKFASIEASLQLEEVPKRPYKAAYVYKKDYNKAMIVDYFQANKVTYTTYWGCSYCQYASYCWKSELDLATQKGSGKYFGDECIVE